MRMYDLIAKKRDGGELSPEELSYLVHGVTDGSIPDYQLSAWLMAVVLRGMTDAETAALTMEMACSGDRADLSALSGVKVDKHSSGGVGDKTTLIALPMAAAKGAVIAKMSGRALGATGGTIDKLESIPGYRTALSAEEFLSVVRRTGISVTGQSGDLAPADKKLYALRDATATVESIPLIAASIMSKKLAAGADGIVLDVKAGSGAFMKTVEDAKALARAMVSIGERNGRRVIALLTDMSRPLGHNIGTALEIREAVETLRGHGPADLTALCTELAAQLLVLSGKGSLSTCRALAEESIADGSAFAKLCELVEAHGGDAAFLHDPSKFPVAGVSAEIRSPQEGFLTAMDGEGIGFAALALGAGRERPGDPVDNAAGIVLRRKTGDRVLPNEPLATLYATDESHLAEGTRRFLAALRFGGKAPVATPLIHAVIDGREYP